MDAPRYIADLDLVAVPSWLSPMMLAELGELYRNGRQMPAAMRALIEACQVARSMHARALVSSAGNDATACDVPVSRGGSDGGHGEWILTSQAADVLGCTPRRVRQFVDEGRLAGSEKVGRQLMHNPQMVLELMEERKHGSSSEGFPGANVGAVSPRRTRPAPDAGGATR